MAMVRIISICSGKGGVGKTTVAANLGIALQSLGKNTAVIDTNFTTAHLGIYFGLLNASLTFNDFLKGKASLNAVSHTTNSGLKIIPSSINFRDLDGMDTQNMKHMIRNELGNLDFVLLDSSPGFGKETLISLNSCDEIILVANPYLPSIVDIAKARHLIESLPEKPIILGIILNRVRNRGYELKEDEVRQFTDMPVIGTIPESEKILAASNRRSIAAAQKGPAHRAFIRLAAKIAAVDYKESFVEKIFSIFR